MKELLNKIYYSFYKCEEFFFPYGRKGGYSSVVMIEMLAIRLLFLNSYPDGYYRFLHFRLLYKEKGLERTK